MIKLTKKLMIAIALVVVVLLLASRFYLDKTSASTETLLLEYKTRQESLAAKENQLKVMIEDLNATLQKELEKQNNLTNQIAVLKNQPVNTTRIITRSSSSSSSSSSGSSQPALTPTPSPPTTGAS